MAKCENCGQEFSEQDEAKVNFQEYMGKFYHRLCPGTYHKCHYCSQDITDGSEVKTAVGYRHRNCTRRKGELA